MPSSNPQVCPACSLAMRPIRERRVEIDFCDGCHAVWLDRGELKSLLSLEEDWHPDATDQSGKTKAAPLNCPNCVSEELETISRRGFEIRVCGGCQGTFVDSQTLDRLTPGDSGILTGNTMKSLNNSGFTIEALLDLFAFFVSH